MKSRVSRHVLAITAAVAVAGCSAIATPDNDRDRIFEQLAQVLTSDGKTACIDSTTRGEPLAIFRTMMVAPDPARRPLAWSVPGPLRPPQGLSSKQMFDDEFRSGRVLLTEPGGKSNALPAIEQAQYNTAARALSAFQTESHLTVPDFRSAPLARSRWWPFNRFSPGCHPYFTVSDIIMGKDIAFVSVTGGHWGTTYAFRKQAEAWTPAAQWTNWLY